MSANKLLDTIKKAGIKGVAAGNPVSILQGKVTSLNPLVVTVEQRLAIPEDFLIVPESLTRYEIDLSHTHGLYGGSDTQEALTSKIVIREGLKFGDAVLLLQAQGGQDFIILDKVVSGI
ncbi:DUF2577 domain-containing protein [Paenibacillus shunpengii]|uniref:DUF2577 domain-containing protein n=1 Tax=Paenibacillus shunpengii TaxID=2054424 RepID=A0ABW5SY79_9BACL